MAERAKSQKTSGKSAVSKETVKKTVKTAPQKTETAEKTKAAAKKIPAKNSVTKTTKNDSKLTKNDTKLTEKSTVSKSTAKRTVKSPAKTAAKKAETPVKTKPAAKTAPAKVESPETESSKKRNSEIRKLKRIYKDLPESQKILVSPLLERVVYINGKLTDTERLLDDQGLVVDFENGDQKIQRVNPYLKVYTDLLKIYSNITEQIEDMIRHDREHAKKENSGKDVDPLEAFINAR